MKKNTSYRIGSQNFTQDNLNKMTGTDANAIYYATHQGNNKANTMFSNPGSFVDTGEQNKPTKEEYDQLVNQIAKIRKSMEEPKTVPVLNKPEENQKVSYVSPEQKKQGSLDKMAVKDNIRNNKANNTFEFEEESTIPMPERNYNRLSYYDRKDLEEESKNIRARGQGMSQADKDRVRDINNLLTEDDRAIYEEGYAGRSFIDRALDPTYQMSKEDEKYAAKVIGEYFDNNPKARELLHANNPNLANKIRTSMTEKEYKDYQKMVALYSKVDDVSAFTYGAMNIVPFGDTIMDKLGEMSGVDNDYNFSALEQNAKTQSPLAYLGGDMTSKIAAYKELGDALEAIPKLTNFTNGLGYMASGGNATVGNALGRIARGTIADIALDTIPTEIENYENGMRGPELAEDTVGNVLLNTVLNGAAEVVPYLLKNVGKNYQNVPKQYDSPFDALGKGAEPPAVSSLEQERRALSAYDDDMAALRAELNRKPTNLEMEQTYNSRPDDMEVLRQALAAQEAENVAKEVPQVGETPSLIAKEAEPVVAKETEQVVDNIVNEQIARYQRLINDEEYLDNEVKRFAERDAARGFDVDEDEIKQSLVSTARRKLKELQAPAETVVKNVDNAETVESIVNPEELTVSSYNRKNGKKGYVVMRKVGDNGLEPVDAFKNRRFSSEESAKKAIDKYAESVTESAEQATKSVETPEANKVIAESAPSNPTLTEEVKPEAKPTKDTADKVVDNIVEEAKKDAENGSNQKVSKAYTNTGKEGGGWNESEYNKYTDPNNYTYESVDEVESVNRATQMRNTEGRETFKKRVMQKEKLAGYEIDGLMMEWRETVEEARALEAQGIDASSLWEESNKIFRKIQSEESNNAQALQALAKWSRNTPEGMLMHAEQIVNKRVQRLKPEKSEAQKMLDRILRKHKDIEFSSDFQNNFLAKAEDICNMTDMDSREAKDAMAELGRMVADQIPVKLPEKVTAYLMNNMLGNFRTLITRNAGGNLGLNAVEQIGQRPLAAGIDKLVANKTGVRTQAGLTVDGLIEYMSGFKKGLADEAHDFKTGLHTARSGENTLENAVNANKHAFNGKNPLSKFLNMKDKLVRTGLSVGDRPFYEAVYNQTIGDYHRLREMGQMGEAIQNLSDADFDLYAKTAASLNGLAAVYQNNSKFANALLDFKKAIGELSEGTVGVDVLSQFSMPFVKTPANVVDRAIDYSPLGLIRNGIRTAREGGIGGADFNQNRFVNELSRNIIGTGLMAGAAGAANAGRMSGSYSDNQEEKQAQKRSGMQEYALNVPNWVPALGGKQMDISWLPVVGSNAVAAAAAVDAYKNGEGNVAQNIGTGLKAGGEALFDQSMFQGLQRLFGSDNSYNNEEGIVGNALNTVKKGVSQVIPSLARQAGQVIDPYQRDVSNSNEGNYDLNSIINNIPIARQYLLAPKVGDNGELMMENQGRNIASKILEDMILPGKLTEVTENPLDVEAKRLSDETGNTVAYRPKASRKDVDTDEHKLTNEEWVKYEQDLERATTEIGNAIINSDYYKTATDPDRERLLDNAYADVKNAIKSDYSGKEIDGGAKVYKEAGGGEAGIQALTDYYADKAYKKEVYNTMGSNSEWATALYESNDLKRIQKYNEAKEIADEYGVSLTENNFLRYEKDGKWGLKKELNYGKKAQEIGISAGSNEQFRKLVDAGVDNRTIKKAYDEITSTVTGKDEFDRDTHLSFNKEAYDIWDKYGKDGLKDYAEIKNGKANWNTYRQAKISYPSLSAKEYVKLFNSLDGNTGSEPNGTIDQSELINYYNSHNVKEDVAKKMWQAYGVHSGDNPWKKVPVLKKNKKTNKTEWQAVQLKKGK